MAADLSPGSCDAHRFGSIHDKSIRMIRSRCGYMRFIFCGGCWAIEFAASEVMCGRLGPRGIVGFVGAMVFSLVLPGAYVQWLFMNVLITWTFQAASIVGFVLNCMSIGRILLNRIS